MRKFFKKIYCAVFGHDWFVVFEDADRPKVEGSYSECYDCGKRINNE